MSAAFSLVMHADTDSGDAHTLPQYEKMFGNAGFVKTTQHAVPDSPPQLLLSERQETLVKKKNKRITKKKNKAGNHDQALREQLVSLLKGGQAHVHFMDAIEGFPEAKRGAFVEGLPHTGWQLLEHARIAQWDILEFSRNAKHVSPGFPEGYWPKTPVPPEEAAWAKSVQGFQHDLQEMIKLVKNAKTNLHAAIPHGDGQTILREALLLADHNAYHLGQLVDLRRALGAWPES